MIVRNNKVRSLFAAVAIYFQSALWQNSYVRVWRRFFLSYLGGESQTIPKLRSKACKILQLSGVWRVRLMKSSSFFFRLLIWVCLVRILSQAPAQECWCETLCWWITRCCEWEKPCVAKIISGGKLSLACYWGQSITQLKGYI